MWPKASTTVRCSSRYSRRCTPARRPLAVTSVASAPSSSTSPENTAFIVGGSTVTRSSSRAPDVPDKERVRRDESRRTDDDESPRAPGRRRAERVELAAEDDRGVAEHDAEAGALVPCRGDRRARAARDAEHEGERGECDTDHVGDLDHQAVTLFATTLFAPTSELAPVACSDVSIVLFVISHLSDVPVVTIGRSWVCDEDVSS